MTEFICMNRLNPFGTGKVFKQKFSDSMRAYAES